MRQRAYVEILSTQEAKSCTRLRLVQLLRLFRALQTS